MSLHDDAVMKEFAEKAVEDIYLVWTNHTEAERLVDIKLRVFKTVNSFMPPPRILVEDTGDSNGYFSWGAWQLVLRKSVLQRNISYTNFVTFCRTIYHETRHAEQFFRIAQGLAAGKLKYPEKTGSETAQAVVAAAGNISFADRVSMFNQPPGKRLGETSGSVTVSDNVLAEWLDIPKTTATNAVGRKAEFANFISGNRPKWFRRDTILLETEEWMRGTYKRGELSVLNKWAQEGLSRPIYRDQPEEYDAHEIGNAIVKEIDEFSGQDSNVKPY